MGEDNYLKYLGKTCPYCKTTFIEGDEIVICSECEMPHHKECFIENKGCTTFGCQGTMKSLVIASSPVIDIQLIENQIDKSINIEEETQKLSKIDKEKLHLERIKECIYDEVLSKISQIREVSNNVNDLITINKLIIELEKLGSYKESETKIKEAVIKRNTMGSYLLNTTKLQVDCTNKISLVKIGLKRYNKISEITGFDVSEFIICANERIKVIERENELKKIIEEKEQKDREEKELREKEKEEESKKNMKKSFKYFIAVLLVLLIIFTIFRFYFFKKGFYDLGLNFMNEGKYREAIIEFEKSSGFSKAEYYIDYCNKMLHYLKGKEYVDKNQFENALKEFEQSYGIEDTDEFIKYCKEKIG